MMAAVTFCLKFYIYRNIRHVQRPVPLGERVTYNHLAET